ncbi:MAG TPA: aldose 1-epimerase family protein [Nocardioides sp.]|nr:aldose 1-epimerase family protein [Nocardioides sp.]
MTNPSGQHFVIRHDTSEAHITEVGATLRALTVGGIDVLDGFPAHERATDGRGQVLAPWPNRIAAGRYQYGGRDIQCPLTEPARSNAIHGLVRWLDWELTDLQPDSITLSCAVRPQPGYEWELQLQVTYQLGNGGLTVGLNAVNTGDERAPFGAGFHPYLKLAGRQVDDLVLRLPATQYLADNDTATALRQVADTSFDFRAARRVGTQELDTAYTGLVTDEGGRATVALSDPEGDHEVQLWVSAAYPHLMVYTGDHVHQPERRRASVAVEPMTCPPQAFRSGIDLIELEPEESWTGDWGLSATRLSTA